MLLPRYYSLSLPPPPKGKHCLALETCFAYLWNLYGWGHVLGTLSLDSFVQCLVCKIHPQSCMHHCSIIFYYLNISYFICSLVYVHLYCFQFYIINWVVMNILGHIFCWISVYIPIRNWRFWVIGNLHVELYCKQFVKEIILMYTPTGTCKSINWPRSLPTSEVSITLVILVDVL